VNIEDFESRKNVIDYRLLSLNHKKKLQRNRRLRLLCASISAVVVIALALKTSFGAQSAVSTRAITQPISPNALLATSTTRFQSTTTIPLVTTTTRFQSTTTIPLVTTTTRFQSTTTTSVAIVTVPYLNGLSVSSATSALQGVGLLVGSVIVDYAASSQLASVCSTNFSFPTASGHVEYATVRNNHSNNSYAPKGYIVDLTVCP